MIKFPGITVLAILLLVGNAEAMIMQECGDRNYVSSLADSIIEGTVEKVESKLVEEEPILKGLSVYTYNTLSIEKYIKGNPLKENRVQIVTWGGTAGGISQGVEDEPTFIEGTIVRVYLREKNGNFSLVCAEYGVEEILPPDSMTGAPIEIWNKTFGGTGMDKAYFVAQTSDEGFILAGETGFGTEETYVRLIKTDVNGKEIWNRIFGKKNSRTANSVMQKSDRGYLFISNNMLTKIDENGKYLWSKKFSGIGNDVINSIHLTEDGDYILGSDTVLIKTDDQGNVLWKKGFDNLEDGLINSVQLAKDNGYILSGNRGKGTMEDAWLIKIDSAGNEQWNRTFGGNRSDYAYYAQQTADGGFVVTGETRSYGAGDFDAWLIKTDASGNEQWNKTFGGTFRDSTYFVKQTPDGGFVLVGSRSYRNYGFEAWLIKTDGSGNPQWIKPFRGDGISSAYSVQMTQDNGFVIAGYTSQYWLANFEPWLIKVGEGNNVIMEDGGRSIENLKQREDINNTVTNHANESEPLKENTSQKLAPSFELYFAVLSVVLLSILKGKVKTWFLR